jgi:hypothetical protein
MSRKPPVGKSLGDLNKTLLEQWHPTKNGNLTAYDFFEGSGKKVWWKCEKGHDHEWEAKIQHRSNGKRSGCPFCGNRKLSVTNSLRTVSKEISEEWYQAKNVPLTPDSVIGAGEKKYWWKCPKEKDHEWQASISNRLKGTGCPGCRGLKVFKSNSLASTHSYLIHEWHPLKNKNLTPFDVTQGSRKSVWWKCSEGKDHEWKSSVFNRTNGTGCPICHGLVVTSSNNLSSKHPVLAKQWHTTRNGDVTASHVYSGGHKKYWWKCEKGDDHVWLSSISKRINGSGCPVCSNKKVVESNNLQTLAPEIVHEWHPTKNKSLNPNQYGIGSHKKVWWKCQHGPDHEWKAQINERVSGSGCPFCRNLKVSVTNNLASNNKNLLREWFYKKNTHINPQVVTVGSGLKVWWKCDKGPDHIWQASVINRVRGSGCPICSGNVTVESTSLGELYPELCKEWHPDKNSRFTPSDLSPGSGQKVWWKCNKGTDHEWFTSVANRVKGRNCPFCTLTPQSRQELTITFELIQFFNINPKGFKTKVNGKLWSIDIYIEEFNLGIEFDGNYWHKGKRELDKLKTLKLKEDGFQIMRIREEPLKIITEIDIVSKIPFNAKQVTNGILLHIINAYTLKPELMSAMKAYLNKRTIQNEEKLNDYIDQILLEKAERKNDKKRTTTKPKLH